MCEIAGVQEQIGAARQRVDAVDRDLQSARDILVDLLAEADVAVADLRERKVISGRLVRLAERPRGEDSAAADRPDHTGANPGHTLEKPAAVDAVAIDLR